MRFFGVVNLVFPASGLLVVCHSIPDSDVPVAKHSRKVRLHTVGNGASTARDH
jgi:hypothetical protein